ncbi:hypothetical protein D3C85_329770 [compost metagenome]
MAGVVSIRRAIVDWPVAGSMVDSCVEPKKLTASRTVNTRFSSAGAPVLVSPRSRRSSTDWFSVRPGGSAPRAAASPSARSPPTLMPPSASTRLRVP